MSNNSYRYHISKKHDIRHQQNFTHFYLRSVFRIIILLCLDTISILGGWYVAIAIYHSEIKTQGVEFEFKLVFISILCINVFFLSAYKSYGIGFVGKRKINLIKAITCTNLSLIPIGIQLYGVNFINTIFLSWAIAIILIISSRWMVFQAVSSARQLYNPLKINIILIGESKDIEKCLPLLRNNKEFNVYSQLNISEIDRDDEILDRFEQLASNKIDEILICSWEKLNKHKKFLCKLRRCGIYWRIIELDEKFGFNNLEVSNFQGLMTLRIIESSITKVDFLLKRIFDMVLSSILLFMFAWLMLAIAILIKIDSSGSIIYKQTRVGLKGKYFKVWKFRTMVVHAEQLQEKLEAQNEIRGGILFKIKKDPRITKVGRILRKYSLDELPQLFNVIRGEMSLVGPRPLPVRDVEKFQAEHYFRHEVLPGITGLWQVSGRSDTDSENLFNLDFNYIQNWSLTLDLKILLRTIIVVLKSRGAY